MSEGKGTSRVVAVIEIGSTGIRLVVAEVDGLGGFKVLDRAGTQSRIGRDVFTSGMVSREGARECMAVLVAFRELIRGYGLSPKDARVIATSALREAQNRDTFVDRVALQTGFRVTIVEDIEENHLMYLAVQQALQDEKKILSKTNSMILEVGGGTTEIMKELIGYGTAARAVLPQLKELIEQFNGEFKAGHFPGDCNKQRVSSVEEAIKAIEAATSQPELRNIAQ